MAALAAFIHRDEACVFAALGELPEALEFALDVVGQNVRRHVGISGQLVRGALQGADGAEAIPLPLWLALAGLATCFFLYGLILSNFNAIAMQPMGQAAGMAASFTGSYSTATGALFGTLIAGQFNGTILPLFTGFAVLGFCALLSIFAVEGGAGLFRGE